jgi:putative ABC transport system permease protein
MLLAGGVAVLVGAFVVNLTMSVTVAQRTRELGLLRCIGADKRQLRRSVLLEALIIGVLAGLAGLGAGYGVAAALRALINTGPFQGHLPGSGFVLSVRTVIAAFAVACLPMVLSALAPARRAGRVAPVAALHDVVPAAGRVRAWRVVAGVLALAAGFATLPIAVTTWQGLLLLPGAALTLVGVRVLGPLFAGRLAGVVGAPLAGVVGGLGRRNAARSPDRTAATASALMIGLALLTMVSVVFASVQGAVLADYHRDHADFQVWKGGPDPTVSRAARMDPEAVRRLRTLPELSAVVTVDCVADDKGESFCAADPTQLARVVDLEITRGSRTAVSAGGVGVSERSGRPLGATLRVGHADLTVTAVYRATDNFNNSLLAPADLDRIGGDTYPMTALTRVAPGVDKRAARSAVVNAVAGFAGVEVVDRAEFHEHDLAQFRNAGAVYRGLTGLAALLGLFGVATTLALSIVERRRELGLLRAVGMQRRQLRSMVRAEGLIVTLVGAALGLTVGILFGWAAARVLAHSSQPTRFTLPLGTLAALVPLVGVAGLLAAAVPARLAARVDILRAVTTE